MTGELQWESGDEYRLLLDGMMEGFAHCRMLYDDAGPARRLRVPQRQPGLHAAHRHRGGAQGRRVTEVLPTIKQETPELLEIYARVAETGEPAEFDIDFTPLDKWLHVSVSRPREGEFIAFFYDVSEREARGRSRATSEERLHRSLGGRRRRHLGVGPHDREERVVARRSGPLYDLDPREHAASYEGWLASVRPEDRDGLESLLREAVANGADLDFEWRVDTRDGSQRWLLSHGSAERDAQGAPVRYRGVVIDVSDRKRALLEMLENEQRYAAIFEHSPIAISLTSMPEGRLISVNAAYCRLIEGPREEIVGHTIVELGIASEEQWDGDRHRVACGGGHP